MGSASRIVVVTGASAGIGRATALEFGRQGWRVALLARGPEGLEGAKRDIEGVGVQAMVIEADVADHAQVEAAASRVEAEWGPIEAWINNAMATIFSAFLDVAPEDYRRATEVTYFGTVWGTRAALARMKPRNRGVIVQVGSALAYRSIPLQAPYCGAKSAVRGFTDSIRSELLHARSGVHITMVQLSAFNTPQFGWGRTTLGCRPQPMGKIFQPEVAARSIHWAATHRRRELWVGWPAAKAIIGTRVVPAYLDRRLAATAVDGQLTDEPLPPDRQDNLYSPVAGDHGAHGRFDSKAVGSSAQSWLAMHPGVAAALVLLGAVAIAAVLAGTIA